MHMHDDPARQHEEEIDAQEDATREPVNNTYLFCCKASRDIAEGEEILIAYVPPEWRHDTRQHVLHERYKFWCRCEACGRPQFFQASGGVAPLGEPSVKPPLVQQTVEQTCEQTFQPSGPEPTFGEQAVESSGSESSCDQQTFRTPPVAITSEYPSRA
jgi:hypothetical protein